MKLIHGLHRNDSHICSSFCIAMLVLEGMDACDNPRVILRLY